MDGNEFAAEFIQTFSLRNVPSAVIRQVKRCLLDLVGASLAGANVKGAKILSDFSSQEMRGLREATVIGAKRKTSCVAASLINGFIANALDIDDGYRKVKGHPGAAVFPTILAVSEKTGATGKQFLEALLIGYEIGIRAGEILHSHYGFYHGSGSWGAIGSAAAASKLLGLTRTEIKNALGIAEAYAPLVPEIRAVQHPAMAPKDGIAWGAMVGTSAAFLAQKGYTGSPSLLGDERRNQEVFSLGKEYKIMNVYFKRYPCCRWIHPAIEGVQKIMESERLTPQDVSRITVRSFSEAVSLFSTPPTCLEDAEYNACYPLAVSVIFGGFTPQHLKAEYFRKPEVINLMKRIVIRKDAEIQKQFPERCLADVEIRTHQGKRYRSGPVAAKGDFDHPLSEEELLEKFLEITKEILRKRQGESLIKVIRNFEKYQTKDLIQFLN